MTFWRVTFPLALPGIVSSLLLAFTVSFDEYVIAFFLSGNRPDPADLHLEPAPLSRAPAHGRAALGSCILFASTIIVVASPSCCAGAASNPSAPRTLKRA